ncbi:MAG: DNA-directed RNA polymerase subunit alpha [Candidatus Gottesmanbacteria bacterium]|nr:DNA-directed RNA polymerase subunit alpha [Candidatus Gottesmanbacteria bacterium]
MVDPNFQIETAIDKPGYGKFILEPLDQGYGQTLGNSLRRVLLASLPGSAIVTAKIEGVKHQFSTLPGMKEDVVEFLMNLKKVRLTIDGDEAVNLTISKTGPGEVTGADIEVPAGVTIVNKEIVLAHLADKKSNLDVSFTAERGMGYISADEKHYDEVGVMSVDALFSPVTRVNYRVEATRVGRMTNLDRLVIEIWTDATVSALEALKSAAKILVSYFVQVYEPKVQGVAETVAVTPAVSDEVLKMRIEELDIPTRIVNALANGGIETIGQLLGTPKTELMKIKNLGTKSLAVVEEKLREKGVALMV